MRLTNRTVALIAAGTLLGACSESSVKPSEHLADAYAEILIANTIYRDDSVRRAVVLDSIAANFGFTGQKEVLSEIHDMTLNPDILRKVLDSTQNRLQSPEEGKNAKGLK